MSRYILKFFLFFYRISQCLCTGIFLQGQFLIFLTNYAPHLFKTQKKLKYQKSLCEICDFENKILWRNLLEIITCAYSFERCVYSFHFTFSCECSPIWCLSKKTTEVQLNCLENNGIWGQCIDFPTDWQLSEWHHVSM